MMLSVNLYIIYYYDYMYCVYVPTVYCIPTYLLCTLVMYGYISLLHEFSMKSGTCKMFSVSYNYLLEGGRKLRLHQ